MANNERPIFSPNERSNSDIGHYDVTVTSINSGIWTSPKTRSLLVVPYWLLLRVNRERNIFAIIFSLKKVSGHMHVLVPLSQQLLFLSTQKIMWQGFCHACRKTLVQFVLYSAMYGHL